MTEQPYQPPTSPATREPGAGGPARPADWADKTEAVLLKKPVYLRGWFIQLMVALLLVGVTAGGVGGAYLYRWHRDQQADLARQRRSVTAFAASPAFKDFARAADAQLVATLNYTTLRTAKVSALLPEVAAGEKARRLMPWTAELPLLPVHTRDHPARVRAATRTATDLLAQRHLSFGPDRLKEARRAFLRLAVPHARTFLRDNPGAAFPALFLDRDMQDILLLAYATRSGGTLTETEHAFVFFALIGPTMWQELEANHGPAAPAVQ